MSKQLSFWSGFTAGFVCGLAAFAAFAQIPPAAYGHQHLQRQQAEAVWGLNAPVATLAAQVHQESGWNCNAKSVVGALGCTQFMPATAADMAKRYPAELGPMQPLNPRWSFRAQARYMRALHAGRGAHGAANSCQQMAFALAAYNGGEGWVIRDRALAEKKGLPADVYFDAAQTVNAGRAAAAKKENAAYPDRIVFGLEPRYVAAGFGRGSCV
jgi:soluble lytic murein transglycosylase-like protein